jgi:hypothetical protein
MKISLGTFYENGYICVSCTRQTHVCFNQNFTKTANYAFPLFNRNMFDWFLKKYLKIDTTKGVCHIKMQMPKAVAKIYNRNV